MTNKTTRKALLLSTLSLVLCFAMLLGTTFAWFTDSVTSTNNIIKAGNLDVEVEYTLDGQNWNPLDGAADLFQKSLWEPGHTEVVALRIKNNGSLALKYTANMNIVSETVGKTKDGADIVLSDILTVSTLVQQVNAIGDITIGLAFAGENRVAYENTEAFKAASVLRENQELLPGDAHYMMVKVDMAETVGNEANHDGINVPAINFGINFLATQFTYENDSFGPDYDLNATYPWNGEVGELPDAVDNVVTISSAAELAALADSVNSGESFAGKTVKLAADINLGNEEWTPIGDADADDFVGFKGTFDGQNFTISNLKVNSNSWGKGLFGYMDAETNATVKNVNIHNANIVASDCAGIIVGYATNGTFENIHVDGDVSVVATVSDGYAGGIAGCGYNANFNNCSVIANNGSKITSAGSFAGGIVGYQCNNKKAITDCKVANLTITGYAAVGGISGIIQTGSDFSFTNNSVENVVLNKTRADGNPSIGAFVGTYSGTAATTLTGKVSNVTLNGTHVEYSAYNELYGSNYSGATTPSFDITGVTASGIINNLNK